MWYTTLYTHRGFFNHGGELCIRSIQSIKIGIDVSIDKFYLIDMDCIDQSVEIDDTLVSFIDYINILIFTDLIDLYRKIHLFICSSKNENWIHANSKFIDFWVERERIKHLSLFKEIFKTILSFL